MSGEREREREREKPNVPNNEYQLVIIRGNGIICPLSCTKDVGNCICRAHGGLCVFAQ